MEGGWGFRGVAGVGGGRLDAEAEDELTYLWNFRCKIISFTFQVTRLSFRTRRVKFYPKLLFRASGIPGTIV